MRSGICDDKLGMMMIKGHSAGGPFRQRCAVIRVGLRSNSRQNFRCTSRALHLCKTWQARRALFDGATAVVLDDYRRDVEVSAEAAKRFEEMWQREGLSADQ
jgi:hypothetical protein